MPWIFISKLLLLGTHLLKYGNKSLQSTSSTPSSTSATRILKISSLDNAFFQGKTGPRPANGSSGQGQAWARLGTHQPRHFPTGKSNLCCYMGKVTQC
ncbi:hypothetical protein PRUPE_1G388800 [Prunus persica]|uniref:Secreted protein n=1 Tax=Prunus persica TaxID=3760 RepID=A0A251R9U8_PRUPE|nr:hypothetical protein PRUPE_1G388800 [Prunus persica]